MPYLREEAHLYYFIRCIRLKCLVYARLVWARTAHMAFVQLSLMEVAIVGLNSTPSIVTRSWRCMSSVVGGSVQAFDLLGISCAPVARSYSWIACFITWKSLGFVTKTVTSSSYAMTGPCWELRPIFMQGRLSSSARINLLAPEFGI